MFNHKRFLAVCQNNNLSIKQVVSDAGYTEGGYYNAVKNNTLSLAFAQFISQKFGKPVDYFLNNGNDDSGTSGSPLSIQDPPAIYAKDTALIECRSKLIQLQDKVIRLQDEMLAMQKKAGAKG